MYIHSIKWLCLLNWMLCCWNSCTVIKPMHYHLMSDFNTDSSVLRIAFSLEYTDSTVFLKKLRGTEAKGTEMCCSGSSSVIKSDQSTPTGCFSVGWDCHPAMPACCLKILCSNHIPLKEEGLWTKWDLCWSLTLKPLGRPRRRWEDNIKMDLREVGWGGHELDCDGSG
jgi:hypothetical protein